MSQDTSSANLDERAIQVSVRALDQCMVLDLHGQQFTYPHTAVLKNTVSSLIEEGKQFFVINLADIQMVDSFGLATILSVLKMAKTVNGNIALCGVNDAVENLVKLTHLQRVLDIWPSESQAAYYLTS